MVWVCHLRGLLVGGGEYGSVRPGPLHCTLTINETLPTVNVNCDTAIVQLAMLGQLILGVAMVALFHGEKLLPYTITYVYHPCFSAAFSTYERTRPGPSPSLVT